MQKTYKVADVWDFRHNDHLIVILDTSEKYNPFVIYRKWYDCGWHRHRLEKYTDMISAMEYITDVISGKIRL